MGGMYVECFMLLAGIIFTTSADFDILKCKAIGFLKTNFDLYN